MDAPPGQASSSPNGNPQPNIIYEECVSVEIESVGSIPNYSGTERRASKRASQNVSDRRSSTGRRAIDVELAQMWKDALRYKFIYSMSALIIGLCCILGGMILFILGMSGTMSWTIGAFGMKSSIADAAPGASLFIVGLFYVYMTRFCPKQW